MTPTPAAQRLQRDEPQGRSTLPDYKPDPVQSTTTPALMAAAGSERPDAIQAALNEAVVERAPDLVFRRMKEVLSSPPLTQPRVEQCLFDRRLTDAPEHSSQVRSQI